MEFNEICPSQERCGNCPVTMLGVECVAVEGLDTPHNTQVAVIESSYASRAQKSVEIALGLARSARLAVETVKGDGCYFTNPDGTVRNAREVN